MIELNLHAVGCFLQVFPRSTVELILHAVLLLLSLVLLVYFMVTLYQCMCPKNYGRWRASWSRSSRRGSKRGSHYYKQIQEALPLELQVHVQVSRAAGARAGQSSYWVASCWVTCGSVKFLTRLQATEVRFLPIPDTRGWVLLSRGF